MKFTICILPTSIHTQCFAELADSLTWALTQLGHEAYRDTAVRPGTRGIVFGARPGETDGLPADAILYNGEQVGDGGMWPQLVNLYARHTIWDYSAANAARYSNWCLKPPQVVRPGYSPVLDGRIPKREKTHDVVFFGSSSERREEVLSKIEARGLSVLRVPFGVYGKDRDKLIAQAKLCINIHYYESSIFEAVRCSYLAQNGVPVLSEESVDGENMEWGTSAVEYGALAEFAEAAITQGEEHLIKQGQAQHVAARQVSLLDDVRAAVAALNEQKPSGVMVQGVDARLRLTLCMIVKNESAIIERCLASVKPHLSSWCVVDTGSTDGTQAIVQNFMTGVPGTVHNLPWKEFDGSRNDALDLARKECGDQGWLLLIDADEVLQIDGELVLPDGYDCYDGWIARCVGCLRWGRPVFVRANKPWFFEMPRHEGLYCRTHAPTAPQPLANVRVLSMPDGARATESEYDRYLRDAKVLEAWATGHPGHSRCQYYLAQSYRDAATGKQPTDRAAMQNAVMHYLKRAEMAGYEAETFSAMYQAANCMTALGYPPERVQAQLLKAFNFRPQRIEPLHTLARYYREQKQYALAELFASKAVKTNPAADIFPDFDLSIYEWRAKEELAVALTYLNRHAEARDLNREVLAHPNLPPGERARIQENLDMCIRTVGP
jgi:hypothetical protein